MGGIMPPCLDEDEMKKKLVRGELRGGVRQTLNEHFVVIEVIRPEHVRSGQQLQRPYRHKKFQCPKLVDAQNPEFWRRQYFGCKNV